MFGETPIPFHKHQSMLKKTMHSAMEFLANLLSTEGSSWGIGQILAAIGLAYLGGVLSSLTPCVYPMIPITVSVIGGIRGPDAVNQRSWREILLRSAAYIFGMAIVYAFLGVLAGLTGKVFGTFTNTPGWYIGLGLVMTYAALVMIDVLPFDPAVWWGTFKRKLGFERSGALSRNQEAEQVTLLGAFTLGASSGFIAAPCTTPVLTSILAFIAKTQSIGLGMALMFSFAMGLGTLLLIIAIFTGALQILPRSGNWMKTIKVLSGLMLLAFAEYLFYRAGRLGGL
jgi:cytochrome c-type biogenesis protein